MPPIRFISTNVRGLNDKVKRSLVFAYLKIYRPHVCIIQENHLVGSRAKKAMVRVLPSCHIL